MDAGPRIAIDAMGGDSGPSAMIAGASRALRKDPSLRFTFYGDEAQVARRARAPQEPARPASRSSIRPKRSRPAKSRARRSAAPARPRWAWRSTPSRTEGRRRAVGREHRRADGHVQARAADHAGDRPPGARRAAADARRDRRHHARPRRQHRMRRAEPRPVRGDGLGLCAHGARALASRA